MGDGRTSTGVPAVPRGGGAGRVVLGGCLLSLLALVGWLVLGLVYLLGDPCLPFCVSSDTGAWGTLTTIVFAGAGLAYVVLLIRLVQRRHGPRALSSTLGAGMLVIVVATAAFIGADVVTAEPRFCSC
jgi:hypothetical protein